MTLARMSIRLLNDHARQRRGSDASRQRALVLGPVRQPSC